MKYVLCNKNNNLKVDHILDETDINSEAELCLYPDFYEIITTEENITTYNIRYDPESRRFIVIDGVEPFVPPSVIPSDMEDLEKKNIELQNSLKKVRDELQCTQQALNDLIMSQLKGGE